MLSIESKVFVCVIRQPADIHQQQTYRPEEKEDDLDPADDGEASEESHGASNKTQLGLRLDLLVSLDVVKGGRAEKDLHQLQG